MGKNDGFLKWQRRMPPRRPVVERIHDWREVYHERPEEESRKQGARCMDCGIPFCQQGCPLGNLIPDWNDLVYRGQWKKAWRALKSTNNFPEFTGRLCPAPCEAACVLAINDSAVTIEQIEKEIAERAFSEGWVEPLRPRESTNKSVGIVGSGPAGLAAAEQLNAAGHRVVVYEKTDRIGGLLRYGIPDFKMEKWVIDRRLDFMHAAGIRFQCNVQVGQDIPWQELQAQHDAVIVAVGALEARRLEVPGAQLEGVHMAMDYLEQQNRIVAGDVINPSDRIDADGKNVIILGGGDTGSDCLGTALRQDAESVMQVELFPQPPQHRSMEDPWPSWPTVFRTSVSQEEGGLREFALMTTHLDGEDGVLERLHAQHVEVVRSNKGVEFRPRPDGEVTYDVDLLVLAMGFTGPVIDQLKSELGVQVPESKSQFRTNVPGIYFAGDALRGASLIVWAISDGREAARQVDLDLMGKTLLPTRGDDLPFGV